MLSPLDDKGFDITKNIKTIEILKSRLLSEVAFLHESMLKSHADLEERLDVISEIILLSYLLSEKLGISYKEIDGKIIEKLRVAMLQENNQFSNLSSLKDHINRN